MSGIPYCKSLCEQTPTAVQTSATRYRHDAKQKTTKQVETHVFTEIVTYQQILSTHMNSTLSIVQSDCLDLRRRRGALTKVQIH